MVADVPRSSAKVGSMQSNREVCAWSMLPSQPEVLVIEDAHSDARLPQFAHLTGIYRGSLR